MNDSPVTRGEEALQILSEIKGKFTDENIRKWRDVCCVDPDIGDNNGSGVCRCPIAKRPRPPITKDDPVHGWCHDWCEASLKLRLRTRLKNIRKYVGVQSSTPLPSSTEGGKQRE